MSIVIIAEAGVNHNGSIELAKNLIDKAAGAGADYVKFQTFTAESMLVRDAPKAEYQMKGDGAAETQFDMIKRLELSASAHETLIDYCKQKSIGFLSTAFDIESVKYLRSHGARYLKIPSGEITNLPFLKFIGKCNDDVILSTGMASLSDVEQALEVLEVAGTPRKRVTVLHCTTQYPTPMEDVNLRAMTTIGKAFGVRVGYSDHTIGIEVAIAAAALGATIIEKHFTLDRKMLGPDHSASLEPDELIKMVQGIRNIEQALGDGIKRISPSELKNKSVARKSIVAARAIRAGEAFSEANLTVKRPGTGLSPMLWEEVIVRLASRDFDAEDLITL